MASSVAQPLERQFAQIPGVTQMTSTSTLGRRAITVQFDLDRNIDAAANDIQAAINAAERPVARRTCRSRRPTARSIRPNSPILLLAATSDTLPLTEVDDYAENKLAQQISQISGVAQVTIGGQQKPAVRIQVDPGQARGQGHRRSRTSARQLVDHDRRQPQGHASTATTRTFTIYANDQLTEAEAWNDVIVAYRERRAGARARHRPGG